MTEGLRITDEYGRTIKITPLVSSIITSGIYASPTALNEDGTYGFDIDLPGTTAIPLENLSVICTPYIFYYSGMAIQYLSGGGPFVANAYANSDDVYYQRDPNTYIMTSWTAGNRTLGSYNTWDPVLTTIAVVEWLPTVNNLYDKIRIFPATATIVIDMSESAWKQVFSLYGLPTTTRGVVESFVCVILKEENE